MCWAIEVLLITGTDDEVPGGYTLILVIHYKLVEYTVRGNIKILFHHFVSNTIVITSSNKQQNVPFILTSPKFFI